MVSLLKDLVMRKHNQFFIGLKNNIFQPSLFFEAVSLANTYFNDLSEKDIKLRVLLLRAFTWERLQKSLYGIDTELKKEFNMLVKSNYAIKVMPIVDMINGCIKKDEILLSKFYKRFRSGKKIVSKSVSFSDIKQKWSVGVVRSV